MKFIKNNNMIQKMTKIINMIEENHHKFQEIKKIYYSKKFFVYKK